MAWKQPKTWLGEKMTIAKLNEQIRDNMLALKDPPHESGSINAVSEAVGTSFEILDVAATISSEGGDLWVFYNVFPVGLAAGVTVYVTLYLDVANLGGVDGISALTEATGHVTCLTGSWLIRDVPAGNHTVGVYWKLSSAGTLSTPTAGTGGRSSLTVRELS